MNGFRITFANVGYGEAMLLEADDPSCENGTFTMLIDGGGNTPEEYSGSTTGRLPFDEFLQRKNITHLDIAVCTHIHEDHISGLVPVFQRMTPGEFWQTLPCRYYQKMKPLDERLTEEPDRKKFIRALNDYREICKSLTERGCVLRGPENLQELESPAEGLEIRLPGPSGRKTEALVSCMDRIYENTDTSKLFAEISRADASMNNFSMILLLAYGGRKILLPGDTNQEGFGDVPGDISADIFKVGHHGQKDGVSRELFRRIHPSAVVCCASSDRRYNSAAPEILQMMREEGSGLYFSDCPDVPPFTDGLAPHTALTFAVSPDGGIRTWYEPCE